MPTSQNGWSAAPDLPIVPLVIDGVSFAPGVRAGDVHTVLGYVAQQFHDRVEPLVAPGCWGFYYRANRNDPTSLSNHSSGTAIDANAPQHPNGVPTGRTYSTAQIAEVHQILAEVDHVVRWGGDYTHTVDAMHFEINADAAAVAAVAARLTTSPKEADMPLNDADKQWIKDAITTAVAGNKVDVGGNHPWTDDAAFKTQMTELGKINDELKGLRADIRALNSQAGKGPGK